MAIEQDILTTIQTALEQSSTLKNYVEKIYLGVRANDDSFVGDNIKNYIILEPLSAEETYPSGGENLPASYGVNKQLTIAIAIIGVVTAVNVNDYSYVTGWGKTKGILDLDEDIKNAIDNSNAIQSLSDAEGVNITTNSFIFETFPKRKVIMTLTISRNFRKGER